MFMFGIFVKQPKNIAPHLEEGLGEAVPLMTKTPTGFERKEKTVMLDRYSWVSLSPTRI